MQVSPPPFPSIPLPITAQSFFSPLTFFTYYIFVVPFGFEILFALAGDGDDLRGLSALTLEFLQRRVVVFQIILANSLGTFIYCVNFSSLSSFLSSSIFLFFFEFSDSFSYLMFVRCLWLKIASFCGDLRVVSARYFRLRVAPLM